MTFAYIRVSIFDTLINMADIGENIHAQEDNWDRTKNQSLLKMRVEKRVSQANFIEEKF